MAQAECVTTAIRELMSRGQPPKSTSLRAAHTELVAALAASVPHPIHSNPNSEDLERRAGHLEKVFAALDLYVTALIIYAAMNIPGSTLEHRYLDQLFQEFSADALGVIRNAVAEMRVHEQWRAS